VPQDGHFLRLPFGALRLGEQSGLSSKRADFQWWFLALRRQKRRLKVALESE